MPDLHHHDLGLTSARIEGNHTTLAMYFAE